MPLGGLLDWFGGSLETLVAKARRRLAAGDFDDAHRLVEKGLARFPEAEVLRETALTIRRAQARAGMQSLKDQIARTKDPLAHEQLVALYQDVGMPEEARRAAQVYADAHPDRDTPHLILGEMCLAAFFEDLLARDAHDAQDHLLRACRLNADAIKPRLLLAELYFCCGADRSLHMVVQALERIAPDDEALRPVLEACRGVQGAEGKENVEALFASVEVKGELVRQPTAWPVRTRRNREQSIKEERTRAAAKEMVRRGDAEEVVVLRHGGALVAHASSEGLEETPTAEGEPPAEDEARGVVGIARSVARVVIRQVREFDLGGFKRCTVQGSFGTVIVGELGGAVVAARQRGAIEPLRLWERVTVGLEGRTR
jgi:hypothetical protein